MNELIFEKDDIPKGWIMTEINEICELIGGGTPSRKNSKYFNGDIIWLTPTEIPKNTIVKIFDSKEKITASGLKESSTKIIPQNSVLLTSRASIGYIAIAGTPVTTNQGFASFVCSNVIHNFYLAYWLMSKIDLLKIQATGTTFKEISKSKLKLLSIFLPPLNEQKCIISKIESIFAQIDAAKQHLERLASQVTSSSGSLAQLKSSVLKQAFDGNLTSQDSDNKHDANEWIVAKLEDITLFSKNGFTGRPNENNSGIPRLGIETITNSNSVFINTSKCKFIDIPSHRLDNYLVQKNDLFFCRQNGNKNYVGKCCIFIDNVRDTIFSDSLILFRIDYDKIYPNYLAYFVNSASGRNQIERYCSTTAGNYSINGTNLKKILIKFPSITEQKKIVAKLESIFGNIDTLNLFYFILLGNLFTNLRYFIILYMPHAISDQ